MTSVIIRIALRYVAALLVAKGLLSPEASDFYSDPELIAGLEVAAGAALGAGVEWWYYLARRWGLST